MIRKLEDSDVIQEGDLVSQDDGTFRKFMGHLGERVQPYCYPIYREIPDVLELSYGSARRRKGKVDIGIERDLVELDLEDARKLGAWLLQVTQEDHSE